MKLQNSLMLTERLGSQYFNNIEVLMNLPLERWREVIIKELLDNALDAVNQLKDKQININFDDSVFAICDNGGGIPVSALDKIYDFELRASAKRFARKVSRGAHGNGLKIIISLCFKKSIKLYFVTNGDKITYTPDKEMIELSQFNRAFKKKVVATDQPDGVYVKCKIAEDLLLKYLNDYMDVNADACFTVNRIQYPKYAKSHKDRQIQSIHWFDFEIFAKLLKQTTADFPDNTTEQFISQFSGTQLIMSKLTLPGIFLKDFYKDDQAIRNLYDELRMQTARYSPEILKKYAIGKKTAKEMKKENYLGYQTTIGSYKLAEEAEIPYMIEAILAKNSNTIQSNNTVVSCINNAKNYSAIPFEFTIQEISIAGQAPKLCLDLVDALRNAGFMSGTGHVLLIHFVSPYVMYSNESKSSIISDEFLKDLLKTISPLVAVAVKAANKPKREEGIKTAEKVSKKSLMLKYFMDGAQIATGNWLYDTTARQVFYAIRKLVNNNHGINLNGKGDFTTLTQDIMTKLFDDNPALEEKIFFERRGFFLDLESGNEVPMSTQRTKEFIDRLNQRKTCRGIINEGRYIPARHEFVYPYNLAISQVLFIEKQGFTDVFTQSDILKDLNLSVISAQGYSVRAIKKLCQYFIEQGIKVYALTDGDITGQLIGERLTQGSKTYQHELDIEIIGLQYADIVALGKIGDAEEYESPKSFNHVLERMNEDERDFFHKKTYEDEEGKYKFVYRRVELNALTMPELLAFIRSKIQKRQSRPSFEQIRKMVRFDPVALKRDAVINNLLRQVDDKMKLLADVDVCIDEDEIANEIIHALDNEKKGEDWPEVLSSMIKQRYDEAINKILSIK